MGDAAGKWLFGLFGTVAIALLVWGGVQLQKLPVIEWRLAKIEAQLDRLDERNPHDTSTSLAAEGKP